MYKNVSRFMNHLSSRVATRKASRNNESVIKSIKNKGVEKRLKKDFQKNKLLLGKILCEVEGGYHIGISIYNTIAFCPYSEMYPENLTSKDIEEKRSNSFHFKIINVDGSSAIVSRKEAIKAKK